MSRLLALAITTPLFLAACGDDATSTPDADAPLLEPPPAGEGQQLTMDVTITAGDETEQCQYIVVDSALEIARFEHVYTSGSHHLLLYQTNLTPADVTTEMFDCTGAQLTELGVAGIAYGAQVPTGDLVYPDGIALEVPTDSVLLIQTHYLNASTTDLDAEVRLNVWYTSEPAAGEAGTLFFYDWAIVVPQDAPASARMRCQVPQDVDLIFGTSHMHRRGVGYRAFVEKPGATEPEMLFETDLWEGVEPDRYSPVRRIPAGSVIDFECNYQGDPDRTIIEGPSAADNEMCMFIASYYPRLDPMTELCAAPGSGPVFDGTTTCAETVGCVRSATNEIAAEQCIVDTCAGSNRPAADLMTCMFYSCGDVCADLGSDCDSCVLDSCAEQFTACQSATCE